MCASSRGWHSHSALVDITDGPAHYVEMGLSAPGTTPVLLLHGILVSSWAWRFNLEPLSRHFRTIALCQKGHGWSGKSPGRYSVEDLAEFVLRFMDVKGIEQVDLVGNSLGGAVSLRLALDYPSRVRRLVLVDSAAVPLKIVGPLLRAQIPSITFPYKFVLRPFVFRLLLRTLAYRNLPIDGQYMEGFLKPLRGDGTITAIASVAKQLQPSLKRLFPRLSEINHPVQLIWGQHDRLVPLRGGNILHQIIKSSHLEVFPDCAHCPHEEAPERFNKLVIDFLEASAD